MTTNYQQALARGNIRLRPCEEQIGERVLDYVRANPGCTGAMCRADVSTHAYDLLRVLEHRNLVRSERLPGNRIRWYAI